MVSADMCYGGKERLNFIPDKAKVNAKLYVETLLPTYPDSLKTASLFLPFGFIFQQDGSNAHTAKLAQDFLASNCRKFIDNDKWPPNSPDLNPLDYHVWGAMLERYKIFNPKTKNIEDLKNVLQVLTLPVNIPAWIVPG